MEINQPLDKDMHDSLHLTGESKGYLKETARWAKFLSILGFVVVGMMILSAFSIGAMLSLVPMEDELMPFPPAILSVFYLGIALLYFFPVLYLYRFSAHMQTALEVSSQLDMDSAFANIKSHYKFVGILAVVILAMYALGIVGLLIFGVSGALAG